MHNALQFTVKIVDSYLIQLSIYQNEKKDYNNLFI